jgi:hypothetical protein
VSPNSNGDGIVGICQFDRRSMLDEYPELVCELRSAGVRRALIDYRSQANAVDDLAIEKPTSSGR